MEERFSAYKISIREPQRTKQVGKLNAGDEIKTEWISQTQYWRARYRVTLKGITVLHWRVLLCYTEGYYCDTEGYYRVTLKGITLLHWRVLPCYIEGYYCVTLKGITVLHWRVLLCYTEGYYCVTLKVLVIVGLLNFYREIFSYKPSAVSCLFFQAGLLPIR